MKYDLDSITCPTAEDLERNKEEQAAIEQTDLEKLKNGEWKNVIMEALGEDIAGEETLKELCIYSAAQTKLKKRPDQALLHLFLPGDSQTGKSWVLRFAGKTLMEPQDFLSFTSMSGKGLNYLADEKNDPKYFEGKVLFIDELAQQSQEARATLKVLMSIGQDQVSNLTVDDKKKSRKQSFTAMPTVWSCSAETFEDAEKQFLNRPMIAAVDEGKDQTDLIHKMQRDKAALGPYYAPQSKKLEALRLMNKIREIDQAEVLILFSDYYEPDDEKARGAIPQFDVLVTAIAFCNRFARPMVDAPGGHKLIFATFEDGIEANRIWGKFIKNRTTQLANRYIEVLEALNKLPGEKGQTKLKIEEVEVQGKTLEDLTVELNGKGKKWSVGYVRNMLSELGKKGLAEYHYCNDGKTRWVAVTESGSQGSHFVTKANVKDGGRMLGRRILGLKKSASQLHNHPLQRQLELPNDLWEKILGVMPLPPQVEDDPEWPDDEPDEPEEPDQATFIENLKKKLETGRFDKHVLERVEPTERARIGKLIEMGRIGTHPTTGAFYWRG